MRQFFLGGQVACGWHGASSERFPAWETIKSYDEMSLSHPSRFAIKFTSEELDYVMLRLKKSPIFCGAGSLCF